MWGPALDEWKQLVSFDARAFRKHFVILTDSRDFQTSTSLFPATTAFLSNQN